MKERSHAWRFKVLVYVHHQGGLAPKKNEIHNIQAEKNEQSGITHQTLGLNATIYHKRGLILLHGLAQKDGMHSPFYGPWHFFLASDDKS